nr:hypothetical protein [Nocardia carnea]
MQLRQTARGEIRPDCRYDVMQLFLALRVRLRQFPVPSRNHELAVNPLVSHDDFGPRRAVRKILQRTRRLDDGTQINAVPLRQPECADLEHLSMVEELINSLPGQQRDDRTSIRAMIQQTGDYQRP